MQPSLQFQTMIASLLQGRQKNISNRDIIKHLASETTFYVITKMMVKGTSIINQTQPFSDQTLIEIDRGINVLKIVCDQSQTLYKTKDSPQISDFQGKKLLHWQVEDVNQQKFTVVKLMSEDGYVQIKLISADQTSQMIYTVCELPSHFTSNI